MSSASVSSSSVSSINTKKPVERILAVHKPQIVPVGPAVITRTPLRFYLGSDAKNHRADAVILSDCKDIPAEPLQHVSITVEGAGQLRRFRGTAGPNKRVRLSLCPLMAGAAGSVLEALDCEEIETYKRKKASPLPVLTDDGIDPAADYCINFLLEDAPRSTPLRHEGAENGHDVAPRDKPLEAQRLSMLLRARNDVTERPPLPEGMEPVTLSSSWAACIVNTLDNRRQLAARFNLDAPSEDRTALNSTTGGGFGMPASRDYAEKYSSEKRALEEQRQFLETMVMKTATEDSQGQGAQRHQKSKRSRKQ